VRVAAPSKEESLHMLNKHTSHGRSHFVTAMTAMTAQFVAKRSLNTRLHAEKRNLTLVP